MQKLFDTVAEQIVQPGVEEILHQIETHLHDQPPNPLQPSKKPLEDFQREREKAKQQLTQFFSMEEERHRIADAMVLLLNQAHLFSGGEIVLQELKKAGETFFDPPQEPLEKLPVFDTMQEQLGLSDSCLHLIYDRARTLLEEAHQTEEALSLFILLTHLNPYIFEHWLGRGLCWQKKTQYFEALHSFAMASLLNIDHPLPHLYSSQCYADAQQEKLASDTLALALTKIPPQDTHSYEAIIAYIHQKIKKS